MAVLMGFSGFDSTKGKIVQDNHEGPARGAVRKNKKHRYRQYINRKGRDGAGVGR